MNPLVSVIIPTYNRAHLIVTTLDSVINQVYTNWECIIVDDGSTDNTIETVNEYVKKDSRFQLHRRPANRLKGGNAARNYGFEVSKGEFVNWFDDDDTMGENFLSEKISSFNQNIDIVIASGYFCDDNLNVIKKMELTYDGDLFVDFLLWKTQIITNSIMIRRNFLNNKNLFEEWIVRGQETEFFSRLFFKIDNTKVKAINSFQFFHRNHPDRKSSKDTVYSVENHKCTAYIYLENYKRVCLLQNKKLITLFHNRIVALWFRNLKFKDFDNLEYLENQFLFKIKNRKADFVKFKFVFFWCRKLNIQSTRIKNFLKIKHE